MLAWVGSLTWLGLRTWFPSAERRAATAVPASVSPAAAYYTLSVGGATVGFASLTLDTTVTTVDVTELIDVRLPAGDSTQRIVQRSRATFDRSLNFQSSTVSRSQSGHRVETTTQHASDSSLAWDTRAEVGQFVSESTALRRGPLAPAAALPLLVVAPRKPRPGMVRALGMIDPLGRRIESVEVAILAESTLVIPDSAALDSVSHTWQAVRSDTARAWRIERRGGGAPVHLWVDEDGLPVTGELMPGLLADRQPFEIATALYRQAVAENMRSVPRGAATSATATRPPALASMNLRLAHVTIDSTGWKRSALPGGYQRLTRDTLMIAAPDSVATTEDAGTGRWDGLIPTEHPMLATAATIVGGDTVKAKIAERLLVLGQSRNHARAAWALHQSGPKPADTPGRRVGQGRAVCGAGARRGTGSTIGCGAGGTGPRLGTAHLGGSEAGVMGSGRPHLRHIPCRGSLCSIDGRRPG